MFSMTRKFQGEELTLVPQVGGLEKKRREHHSTLRLLVSHPDKLAP